MAKLAVTEQAENDISDILLYTRARWGERQYWSYFELVEEALGVVAADPRIGRPRHAARPGVLGHHIKKVGREARHIVFYRFDESADTVTVLRVLHDSMDFDRHLP